MKFKKIPGGLCASRGFKAAGAHCGIRRNAEKKDMMLLVSEIECDVAAVYTQNKVKGAPILLTQHNIQNGKARGILCNSGNANTCSPGGFEIAKACCELAAQATQLSAEDFVIASTGVIGQELPMEPFEKGIPKLATLLSENGGSDAADAIMTTDTKRKEFAYEFEMNGKTCHIGAIGKGSGMINPNMATMLVFVTTDIAISGALLQEALQEVTLASFNQLYVDGDTSTNDTMAILANGLAENSRITEKNGDYELFCEALYKISVKMCRALAADGEGATKMLECHVQNAPTVELARKISKSVVASDLCKTAMFGEDANWGRVLCAIGYTPGEFSVENISLVLKSDVGEVLVCQNSIHYPFSEEEAAKVLAEDSIQILIDMHDGKASGVAYGCDLSYDYVKINGDYRT